MSFAERSFDALVEQARRDPWIVGLVLGGSRGKRALVTERSDYDAYMILADSAPLEQYRARFVSRRGGRVEHLLFTLDGFREHGMPGTASRWDAYNFAHVEPLIDKLDGEITRIVMAKPVAAPEAAAEALDAYINAAYRAATNLRDGRTVAAHLDAAESIPWLLEFVFAAHGRVRPYNKWLEWELTKHPLPLDWTADLPVRLDSLLAASDPGEQQSLFGNVEGLSRSRDLGGVVDSWEPDLALLRG